MLQATLLHQMAKCSLCLSFATYYLLYVEEKHNIYQGKSKNINETYNESFNQNLYFLG